MRFRLQRSVVVLVLTCLLMFTATQPAKADIISKTDVVLIFVAVAAVAAAITVGVVYAARRNPSIKGCVTEGASGLQMLSESDSRTWMLVGDTAKLRAGERMKVSGKKRKIKGGQTPTLIVEKVGKDYGACHLATP